MRPTKSLMGLGLLTGLSAAISAGESHPARGATATMARLPHRFEVNQGQAPNDTRFLVRGAGFSLLLKDTGATLVTQTRGGGPASLSLELVSARDGVSLSGIGRAPGVSHYLRGADMKAFRTDVPQFDAVKYEGVYDGVDLVHYGAGAELEYDFIVHPGADPGRIAWRVRGASLTIDTAGNLHARTSAGVVVQRAPLMYQEGPLGRVKVEGAFVLKGDRISFAVGPYDKARTLVIDPVLTYASYLGGASTEVGQAIALDAEGNLYVAGTTSSVAFPTAGPFQGVLAGSQDAFVVKLDPTGSTLLFATYFGGSSSETGTAIAVAPDGSIWFGGTTSSTNLPTVNPLIPTLGAFGDAFVARLDAAGSSLLFSTYLGGSGSDQVQNIAVNASGQAHVVGYTFSSNFPRLNAWQGTRTGASVGFVSKFNPGGSLVFSTFIGAGGDQSVDGVATDAAGNVYLTGYTTSSTFPVVNARQAVKSGAHDAFLVKLTPAGAPVYSTFLGGNGEDRGKAIAVDSAGAAYVTGFTDSSSFPTVAPLQPQRAGSTADVFIAKLRANNTAYDYATYLGGTGYDQGRSIKVDSLGRAYVSGLTCSTNFPTLVASQGAIGGGCDGFVAKISGSGSTLLYSTYFGGSESEDVYASALDSAGRVYLTGQTFSVNLPTAGALQASLQGTSDAFIAHLDDPNTPPVANAGLDKTVELPLSAALTGAASTDPDGDPLTYEWRDDTDAVIASTVATSVSGAAGTRVYSLIVTDNRALASTDPVAVTFLPEQAPSVALVAPVNTTVYVGVPQLIQWTAADNGVLARIDVFVSLDGGLNYSPVAGCASLPGSALSCTGTLPGPGASGVRLMVRATDAAGHVGESTGLVTTVDGIVVTSHNLASSWPAGSTQTITWNHELNPGSTFKIELSVNGGLTWRVLAADAPDTGASEWTVVPPLSANARIRVSSVAQPAIADINDAPITIGTPAYRVKDIRAGSSSSPSKMINLNGTMYFVASDVLTGTELWKSDGTEAGTSLVKDITPGTAGSSIDYLVAAGNRLYFRVAGAQLWRSDGTAAGTVRLDSGLVTLNQPVVVGDVVYASGCGGSCGLMKATATSLTTVTTAVYPEEVTNVNGTLFFSATQGTLGKELWKSNGTSAGTVLVKDINDAAANLSSSPLNLTAVGDRLFFSAINYYLGRELHQSDGTALGTSLIKNEAESYTSFYVQETLAFGSRLFYRGYYYNGGPTWDDPELYVSDGTAAGTARVKDICPGETCHGAPVGLTALGDYVYFVAYAPTYGVALFRSDGTDAGTIALKSVIPSIGSSPVPASLRVVDNILYFTATDASGAELWRTDGTPAGTYLVQDIAAGSASSTPSDIRSAGHRMFFAAQDTSGDRELWAMDVPANELPTVAAGADQAVNQGMSVNVSATGSDPDGDTLAYEWRDGSNTVVAGSAAASLSLLAGVHTLTVTVSDGHGGSASDTLVVTVRPSLSLDVAGRGTIQADASAPCGDPLDGAPQVCTRFYQPDAIAHLVATPAPNAVLQAWTGACASAGTAPTCDVTMSAAASAGATFEGPYTLTIESASLENGIGSVFVSTGLSSVQCDAVAGTTMTCSLPVRLGDTVLVSATPVGLSILNSFDGCTAVPLDPNGAGCFPLVVTGPQAVRGTFRGPQTLTVEAASFENGIGSVFVSTGVSGSVQCDAVAGTTMTCSLPVRMGDPVLVSATPIGLSILNSCDGCTADPLDPNGSGCFPLVMTGPQAVRGTFRGPRTLGISFGGDGSGDVVVAAPTASCASAQGNCTFLVRIGAVQQVTASPSPDSLFQSWAGGCAGQGAVCSITITENVNTQATFVLRNHRPVAHAGDPYTGVRNQPVAFSGAASTDPEPDTLTYTWDFGDASPAGTGVAPTHAYATTGTFTVTLTVNDGTVNSAPATSSVTISNQVPTANAGGPYSGVRNQTITFNGAASNDPDGDTLTYSWDFGDGSAGGTGVAPTHAYAVVGTFTVTLTVNDGTANWGAATSTLTISNQAPTANAGGPYSGVRNQAIMFSGAASNDLDGDALTYSWNFGDGSAAGTGVAPTHAYLTAGTFTVTLTVNDGTANSAPVVSTSTISNQAPTANAGGPYSGVRNQPVTFSGVASNDPDGDALTYSWNFGDGSPVGTGVAPTHAYATTGTFTVTLTVNDGTANSAAATSTATISNQAPTANVGGPYSGVRNQAITFNGTASNDPDGDTLTYSWNFGDGSPAGTGVAPTHAYSTTGTFTVALTVNDGTTNSTAATTSVTISNRTPTANAGGPYSGVRNQTITFNGAASNDPDGDTLTYTWSFGDGSAAGTGVAPIHAYTTMGTFTVTLTVNDGTTNSTAATTSVTISNRTPTANAGGPYSGTRLAAIAFNGSASTDPDADSLTYSWNFGDGGTATGPTPSHLYAATGTFTVTLTVNDGTANSAPATTTVQITNVASTVSVTSPGSGAVFHAPAAVSLTAAAADSDGTVAKVEFFAGAAKAGEALNAPYAIVWAASVPGAYSLTAVVTDSSSATVASAPVAVIINAPPTASLTAPANNAQFAAPASITLTATAADSDGSISQVEFFRGTTSLGVDSSSPFSATWSGAAVGSYQLTAVATDNRGAVTTSATVTVKVTATLAPTADSYVRANNSNSNFGTATEVTVQEGSSNSNIRWTYMKFDLATIPTITNAKVRLFGGVSATTSTAINTAVYSVSDTTWTETGIKWSNKPATGTTALSTVAMVNNSTTARWYEFDVTACLQAEKTAGRNVVTLAFKNLANSTPYVTFASKEGTAANRPQVLVVP